MAQPRRRRLAAFAACLRPRAPPRGHRGRRELMPVMRLHYRASLVVRSGGCEVGRVLIVEAPGFGGTLLQARRTLYRSVARRPGRFRLTEVVRTRSLTPRLSG